MLHFRLGNEPQLDAETAEQVAHSERTLRHAAKRAGRNADDASRPAVPLTVAMEMFSKSMGHGGQTMSQRVSQPASQPAPPHADT